MASAFGHLFAGLAIKKTATEKPVAVIFWFYLLFSTVLPDLDVLAFRFGIPYASPLGHRGFTHSILFAVLWSLLLTYLLHRRQALVLRGSTQRLSRVFAFVLLFLATMSHGLLDACTNGGLGVGFFIPFENSRYFFPWRPIAVSPIGVTNFFDSRAWSVILSEALWIGLPGLVLWILAVVARRFKKHV
jgi:inner membrane protein